MRSTFFVLLIILSISGNINAGIVSVPDSLHTPAGDSLGLGQSGLESAVPDSLDTPPWHQMITRIPEDYYSFFKNTFSSSALPVIAGLAALTGTLMTVDEPLNRWGHSLAHRSGSYRNFRDLIVETGDGRYHLLLAGAFSIYGVSAGDSRALRTASNLAEGLLVSGILVQVIKRITGRGSPAAFSNKSGMWRLFPNPAKYQRNQPGYYAFPSGHMATASLTITVLANNYPEAKWIRPVGYGIIGGLGLGLISKGMHWVSDFPLGMLIGYAFGNIVAPERTVSGNQKEASQKGSLSILPLIGPTSGSVAFIYSF